MIKEPGILFCTQRDAIDSYGLEEIHIECRFDNGDKTAAVIIDSDYQLLADSITEFLNIEGLKNQYNKLASIDKDKRNLEQTNKLKELVSELEDLGIIGPSEEFKKDLKELKKL